MEKLIFEVHFDMFCKTWVFFLVINLAFFYLREKKILKTALLSVLGYGEVIYGLAACTTLWPLDAVYHSALRFITRDSYGTHYCLLHQKSGQTVLLVRRDQHLFLFIYKGILKKSPPQSLSRTRRHGSHYKYQQANAIASYQDLLSVIVLHILEIHFKVHLISVFESLQYLIANCMHCNDH